MRNVLDPHRHYKKQGGKLKVPGFSQVGTLKEGPTEFYSTRLTNKERKQTLVEQVLSGAKDSGKYKSKYNAIQERKKSGKKGHFKAKMRERYGDKYNGWSAFTSRDNYKYSTGNERTLQIAGIDVDQASLLIV